MGGEWQSARLLDLYDVSSGLSKPAKDFGSGFPFLAFKDVFNNAFVPSNLSQLVQSNEKEQVKCSVLYGDVFLTRTSETMDELGMSSVALKDYPNATFNGFTKRLRPKESNDLVPEYVGYYLRSPMFRQTMLSFSTMSTRASLNNEMIGKLAIEFPAREQQRVIASYLKSLDDKIELNRQINTTLESMAQALFKSWFVDFDPVIDNALAAGNDIPDALQAKAAKRQALGDKRKPLPDGLQQQFPDRFVFTEEMGWVPEGWEVGSIYELAEVVYGAPFSSKQFNEDRQGRPIIRIRDLKTGTPQMWSEELHPKATLITGGDVVVGMDAEFRPVLWSGEDGYLNQRLFLARADYINSFYVQFSLSPLLALEELAQVGTTVAHLGKKDIDKFVTLKASHSAISAFSKITGPMHGRLVGNYKELRVLVKIRDTLLPKLLSGELRIPEAEKQLAEAL